MNEKFRGLIEHYEQKIGNQHNIFKGNLIGNKERELITDNMNAFLLGLIADQSVKAELAWSLPHKLSERLKIEFCVKTIADMELLELEMAIQEKPALHRYPKNIAKYIHSACNKLVHNYNSDAQNIWINNETAKEIVRRLEEFSGISHKKAALGTMLLVRDFNIDIHDKENINLAYDVHIRRICLRTGLSNEDTPEQIFEAGRKIFPEFPGRLTSTFWGIGRDICRPTEPDCTNCPINEVCAKQIWLGKDISA